MSTKLLSIMIIIIVQFLMINLKIKQAASLHLVLY